MQYIPPIQGINHLGLVVDDIGVARQFFCGVLGFSVIEDRGELLFLRAGTDVVALKTPRMAVAKPEHGLETERSSSAKSGWQALDHYGFFAPDRDAVDAFAKHLQENSIRILKGPYDRSDGRSVYFKDPCGNVGEYFFFSPKT